MQNVVALADAGGDVVERYDYEPYGKLKITDEAGTTDRTSAGSSYGNCYTYTGRYWDADAGLYYYRNRWYSVDLARFTTRDPAGNIDGASLYQYGGSSPARHGDGLGLFFDTLDGGGISDPTRDSYGDHPGDLPSGVDIVDISGVDIYDSTGTMCDSKITNTQRDDFITKGTDHIIERLKAWIKKVEKEGLNNSTKRQSMVSRWKLMLEILQIGKPLVGTADVVYDSLRVRGKGGGYSQETKKIYINPVWLDEKISSVQQIRDRNPLNPYASELERKLQIEAALVFFHECVHKLSCERMENTGWTTQEEFQAYWMEEELKMLMASDPVNMTKAEVVGFMDTLRGKSARKAEERVTKQYTDNFEFEGLAEDFTPLWGNTEAERQSEKNAIDEHSKKIHTRNRRK